MKKEVCVDGASVCAREIIGRLRKHHTFYIK